MPPKCGAFPQSLASLYSVHGHNHRCEGWALHRRLDAVLLCVEPGGSQFAVLMLECDDEHRDAGLQEADIARCGLRPIGIGLSAALGKNPSSKTVRSSARVNWALRDLSRREAIRSFGRVWRPCRFSRIGRSPSPTLPTK